MADIDIWGDTAEEMSTEDIPTEVTPKEDTTVEKMSTEDSPTEDTPKEDITEEEPQPEKVVKEELVKEETEELTPNSVVKETVDENGDVFEETTEVTRKVVKRTMKITETSSTTKTTTMTTPAKLYGKDLSEYDEVDVDALLAQLSPEEINILAKEVDPDDNFLPPNQRCSYECTKESTGPLNRKKLIEHINKEALETPDLPELEPYVKGTVRGKKWVPPPRDEREIAVDEQIAIDMGEEYEHALSDATQEEIIDLAAILGFHSMMNQDQYHASLLNKGQPVGMGWDGITKSTTQKLYPMDPPNNTDVEDSIKRVKDDDPKLIELNLNNIKNISDEKFEQLFDVLPQNEHLEVLSLTNVGLTDKTALLLAEAIEKSKTLRVLNVETNFINPPVVVTLVKALLKARTIEEFRASNQRSTVLGNKIEMEITDLVEKNTSLLRLGLHLEFNDARHRVAAHLQRNIDRNEHALRKGTSSSPIPNVTSAKISAARTGDDLSSMLKAKSPKPIHSVLTSKDRIDSKSELIVALESQKVSDSGRSEISLMVPEPQAKALSRSPPNDRVNSDRRYPVSLRAEDKSPEPKDGKQTSPSRNPKIGELRGTNLSRAVDVDSLSKQESNGNKPVISTIEAPTQDNGIKVVIDSVKIEKETTNLMIQSKDLSKTPRESPTPITAVSISKADVSAPLSKPEVDNPTIKVTSEDSVDVQNPKSVDQVPLVVRETLSTSDHTADTNRESVSPGRRLEGKMEQLRAKIDSFAEVADEKLSSLRSKFDDLARDTTLDQVQENLKQPRESSKAVAPEEPLSNANKPSDLVKPIDAVTQQVDPNTLPPKAPQNIERTTKVAPKIIPYRPPLRTSNSVGITFVYQRQLNPKLDVPPTVAIQIGENRVPIESLQEPKTVVEPLPMLVSVTRGKADERISDTNLSKEPRNTNRGTVEPPQMQEKVPEPLKPEVKKPLPESTSQDNAKIPNRAGKVVEALQPEIVNPSAVVDQATKSVSEISKPINLAREAIPTESGVQKSPEKPKQESQPSQSNDRATEGTCSNPNTQQADTKTISNTTPQENKASQTLKSDNEKTALSLLSIKKGDIIQIAPIKKVEVETQSPVPRSALSRLSVKKGDPQKIDPPKTVEIGTQSPAKPNPMSLISLKKRDVVDIAPVKRAEVSTQFAYKEPKAEASSQTIEEDPIQTTEEATQTPLVFSSLEHDYIFPGLRRVPHLPRSKTINIGSGDRVIVKPSSKSINEILMVLYPVFQDYSQMKPQDFGIEQDILQAPQADNTIKDLEETMSQALEASDAILKAPPRPSEDVVEHQEEVSSSIRAEIEIPLSADTNQDQSVDDSSKTSARFETMYTAVEKVSASSRTTIESGAHVEVIDKAYKSVAKVSSTEGEHISKTSIRSANMWESLSSNLIKASEQTLIDISKASELGRIGKVSVYSSVEDLSHTSRSKYSDRHIGGLIKTVEKTTVYSSTEDIPITAYTRYKDRYNEETARSKAAVYSSNEDLEQSSHNKYSDRYASDLIKSMGKRSVYSSTEDLSEVPYTKYSDRYSENKAKTLHYSSDTSMSKEDLTLLPSSKFSDRYTDDHVKVDTHRSKPKFPISHTLPKTGRSYYKSAVLEDYSSSRLKYKSTEDHSIRSSVIDRGSHKYMTQNEASLQNAILSSISRNQSALRPYTYVPTSVYTDLAIDHVPSRPVSPSVKHTSTLQLNISPLGIRELTPSRYSKDNLDNPRIVISRPKERPSRAISPIARSRASENLLSPHRKVSDHANDNIIDESSQSTLDISSASAASTASTANTTTTSIDTPPKKRVNIMDTIKMLKNRVRDVITTEDRFSENHRLPSSSSSSASVTSRAARTSARTTSSSLNIPHDDDEKEI